MEGRVPLPPLFMRSVIMAIKGAPKLRPFVGELMSRLISKQIWLNTAQVECGEGGGKGQGQGEEAAITPRRWDAGKGAGVGGRGRAWKQPQHCAGGMQGRGRGRARRQAPNLSLIRSWLKEMQVRGPAVQLSKLRNGGLVVMGGSQRAREALGTWAGTLVAAAPALPLSLQHPFTPTCGKGFFRLQISAPLAPTTHTCCISDAAPTYLSRPSPPALPRRPRFQLPVARLPGPGGQQRPHLLPQHAATAAIGAGAVPAPITSQRSAGGRASAAVGGRGQAGGVGNGS